MISQGARKLHLASLSINQKKIINLKMLTKTINFSERLKNEFSDAVRLY